MSSRTTCKHFSKGTCKHGDTCKMAHTKGTGGGGAASAAPAAECPICCSSKGRLAMTSCCGQAVCYGCVKGIIVCKGSLAQELTKDFLGRAHQCPKCSYGPVEHFACPDLTGSDVNTCPKCRYFSPTLDGWVAWDGTLPPAFRSMEGHFPCPFCRKDSAVSSAFGKETTVCTKCKKLWHTKLKCTYIECRQCGRPGHLAKDCTDVVCFVCKKKGHRSSDCRSKKACTLGVACSVCKKKGHRSTDCRYKKDE